MTVNNSLINLLFCINLKNILFYLTIYIILLLLNINNDNNLYSNGLKLKLFNNDFFGKTLINFILKEGGINKNKYLNVLNQYNKGKTLDNILNDEYRDIFIPGRYLNTVSI